VEAVMDAVLVAAVGKALLIILIILVLAVIGFFTLVKKIL
jgi:hypothetical protein